jgi:predicted lysophospholipase L1 biosynthesis ABC-type transport system permease subunit
MPGLGAERTGGKSVNSLQETARIEPTMKILRIVSGICVLFTVLAYGHLLHHHVMHSPAEAYHSAMFWGMFLLAAVAGVFAFVGGCLLLKGGGV